MNMSLFRIMAIDFGDARIGLALSDPMRVLAQPFRVLDNRGEETL
ncbi:MAG: Holliday junction resolvase RuvX, partial [Candidatus Cloacimonetes bacterium]|nr:Holliday junction resolvase RuvX [Candidatus Cloacimonadota bacterium]